MSQQLLSKFRQHQGLVINLGFFCLSLLAVLPFWLTMHVYSGPDLQFHLSRIEEMLANLQNGAPFSHIATRTFNQIGDAVVACYPWIWLYIFAGLRFVLSPISAIYFAYVLVVFATLVIAYYSMKLVSKSSRISFHFAILYGLTTYLVMEIITTQFGEFLAYPFIPLAFAGLYEVMFEDTNRWYLLTIGVTGIMYAHAPTTLIVVIALLVFYLAFFTKQPVKERAARLMKIGIAAVYSLILSLIVWGPIAVLAMSQKLMRPNPQTLYADPQSLFTWLNQSLANKGIGLILLLLLIFGGFFIKRVPPIGRYAYFSSFVTLFVLSNLFPWNLIHHIPLLNGIEAIQSGHRIIPVLVMFIAAFGSYLLATQFSRRTIGVSALVIVASLCLINSFDYSAMYSMNVATDQNPYDNQFNRTSQPELTYKATPTHQIPRSNLNLQNYKVNNQDYQNQFPTDNGSGRTDYLPMTAGKHIDDLANKVTILNGQRFEIATASLHPGNNSLSYQLAVPMKKGTTLDLPFVHYAGMNYTVKFNGKTIQKPATSNRGTFKLTIPQTVKQAKISIQSRGVKFNGLFTALSIVGWLGLLGLGLVRKYRKRINLS